MAWRVLMSVLVNLNEERAVTNDERLSNSEVDLLHLFLTGKTIKGRYLMAEIVLQFHLPCNVTQEFTSVKL